MLRFQVGDKAVYPAQGVAEIVGIEQRNLRQDPTLLLLAHPRHGHAHLGPVDKADQVGLREVVQEDQIKRSMTSSGRKRSTSTTDVEPPSLPGLHGKIKTGSLFRSPRSSAISID